MVASEREPFERVRRAVGKPELVKLVRELVKIPSHADAPAKEQGVAEFLCEFFEDEGIDARKRYAEKGRPNVIARVKGHGQGKTLMLNGHMDTVAPGDMDIAPFSPAIKAGRLYGRGALDMKGGLGAMAMALVAVERSKTKLRGDVVLTAVVGEEHRSEGTEDIVLRGPAADMAIVGEPTSMEIQPWHRGLEWLEVHVHGKAAHGGQADKGVNAISQAARFVNLVEEDLAPRLKDRKSRYTQPPSVNIGVIRGGQQPSSVADKCVVKLDRRWIPEENLQQVFEEMYAIFDKMRKDDPSFRAELRRDPANMKTMTHVPNVVRRNHKIVQALQDSVRDVTGREAVLSSFWGWTDAALLTSFGKIPAVVFGPGGAGAHARTEYVLTDDLVNCMRIYSQAALRVCSSLSRR